jgi:methionine biosynthesis protein MetW
MQDFPDYDGYWARRDDETVIPRWQVAAACIPDGASVLDVGCGTGGFLSHLREVRPHCRAQGVDISPRAVAVAVERGHDAFVADLVVDDIPGRYDVITCFETIEHIAEAEVVLQKIRDACDGTILMSLPNFGFIDHRIRLALFGRFPDTNIKFHVKDRHRLQGVGRAVRPRGRPGPRAVRQPQAALASFPWPVLAAADLHPARCRAT